MVVVCLRRWFKVYFEQGGNESWCRVVNNSEAAPLQY